MAFCMCMGHNHGSCGIDGQGQMSRFGLGLSSQSQFETQLVGRRSQSETIF